MTKTLYEYCIENNCSEILEQWDSEKNIDLTVNDVSYGSRKRIWWRCQMGHSWLSHVYTRTSCGSGCPYCHSKRPVVGENDLASQRPALAAEWHPTKNGLIKPTDITYASHKKVWWLGKCGHEWQAAVNSRSTSRKNGCPICARHLTVADQNSLSVTHPDLAREWHPTKNLGLNACDVVSGTKRKVWWKGTCGHEWQATVLSRVSGSGCPVCAGKVIIPGENDLATFAPDIASQWHPNRNESLSPDAVSPYSNRKVWWICNEGHEYQMDINHRTGRKSECPYCTGRKVLAGFNDLATKEPKIAAQWHPELNGALTPEMVSCGSNKKVWWQCADGHVWKAVIYSRTGEKKCGCPVCAGKTKRQTI